MRPRLGDQVIFCIWDSPTVDSLTPVLGSMMVAGWQTEVIPVEKIEDALPKLEKAYQDAQA